MRVQIWDHEPGWDPSRFHGLGQSADDAHLYSWKETAQGILVAGQPSEFRTRGEPTTVRRIIGQFGDPIINRAATIACVPREIVAAIIAAESKGLSQAEREEPSLSDASIGLTQTLTATAAHLAKSAPADMGLTALRGEKPLPKGGSIENWRHLLCNPVISINLGAWAVRVLNDNEHAKFDPVLIYAAYNAGSVRPSASTPWGIHYYRRLKDGVVVADAMLSFVKWYGDACAVYGEQRP